MDIQVIERDGKVVAVVKSGEPILCDVQSALDLMATVQYETGCYAMAVDKEAVAGDFFRLSTRLAGDILQKFVNYGTKIAIFGDFSGYTSKPLKDFIYESNNGRDVFFVSTEEEALAKLFAAL